jgi:hypothetical protein
MQFKFDEYPDLFFHSDADLASKNDLDPTLDL